MKKDFVNLNKWSNVGFMLVLAVVSQVFAQSPPAWQPMGNLPGAGAVYDILEIPNTNIILACGTSGGSYHYAQIFRSVDGGQSWSKVFDIYGGRFLALHLDEAQNVIFSTGATWANLESRCVVYSLDFGSTWTTVYNPPVLEESDIEGSVLDASNNNLYLIYNVVHGINGYHPELWRLNYSDPDPNNWTWEFLMIYPEGEVSGNSDNVTPTIALKDTILYAFMKDDQNSGLRIYTHSINQLNSMAKAVCTVAEAKEYFNAHPIVMNKDSKNELVNPVQEDSENSGKSLINR